MYLKFFVYQNWFEYMIRSINKYCHRHIKKRENIKLKLCMSEKLSMNSKKRSWINQKAQEEESYPKTINFSARSLRPPPPSSPSCIQEGKSILKRGVQNCPYPSPTVIKPLMYLWKKWNLQREVHVLLPTSPSPFPSTHTHTHAPNPWYTLEWKSSLQKGVYMLSSRERLEEREQVSKETVVLRQWGI